jgi:hypothetical protein
MQDILLLRGRLRRACARRQGPHIEISKELQGVICCIGMSVFHGFLGSSLLSVDHSPSTFRHTVDLQDDVKLKKMSN